MRYMKQKTRAQVAIEYILLLGGVIIVVAITTFFLQNSIFAPQTKTIENQTGEVKDMMKQLREETPVNPGWIYPASTGKNT